MEAVIKEIMGLVAAYGAACETFGDYQVAANAQDCVKAKAAVESRLRQALQCQGCDVPKDGVYQISEPMPADKRAVSEVFAARAKQEQL